MNYSLFVITSINCESDLLTTLFMCLFPLISMKFEDLLGMMVKSFIGSSPEYRPLYGERLFFELAGKDAVEDVAAYFFLILYDLVF